jgi:hypothetical protein
MTKVSAATSSSEDIRHTWNATSVQTVPLSKSLAIRIYADTRPHNWKIAELQKGLILVCNGSEKVGEGAGFGLPVLVCSDETYFSGTSSVRVSRSDGQWSIRKEFLMDRVARNNFRNVNLQNRGARSLLGYLSRLYREQPQFRFLVLKKLTRKIHIGTSFVETAPSACVAVTYKIGERKIQVHADFRNVKTDKLEKIFMLNEQGSMFFQRYLDSEGSVELRNAQIGAWDEVRSEWASIDSPTDRFGFRLWKKGNVILRRGREYVEGSLDWTGLDYEISSGITSFDYTLEILGL